MRRRRAALPVAAPRRAAHYRRHRRHRRRGQACLQSGRGGDRWNRYCRRGDCGRRGGALSRRRRDQRGGIGCDARSRQHAHARTDGAVSRAGRRSSAAAMAREIYFSSRGQDGVARDGARRNEPRRGGDDRIGHHHLRRHVLLRRRDRAGDKGRGTARRARADHHSISRRGRKDTG